MGISSSENDYVAEFEVVGGGKVQKAFTVMDLEELFKKISLYETSHNLRFSSVNRLNNLTHP